MIETQPFDDVPNRSSQLIPTTQVDQGILPQHTRDQEQLYVNNQYGLTVNSLSSLQVQTPLSSQVVQDVRAYESSLGRLTFSVFIRILVKKTFLNLCVFTSFMLKSKVQAQRIGMSLQVQDTIWKSGSLIVRKPFSLFQLCYFEKIQER